MLNLFERPLELCIPIGGCPETVQLGEVRYYSSDASFLVAVLYMSTLFCFIKSRKWASLSEVLTVSMSAARSDGVRCRQRTATEGEGSE